MSTKVKICGITNIDDARVVVQAGADFLGFIFYEASPRGITPETANSIVNLLKIESSQLPQFVGVFVNERVQIMQEIAAFVPLDLIQLSGDDSPDVMQALHGKAYKAIQPQNLEEAQSLAEHYTAFAPTDESTPQILVDSYHPNLYGGTGKLGNPDIIDALGQYRMMLAGGLNPENVAEQIRQFQPFAVDVSSGVEKEKGIKDHDKVWAFIETVRSLA